MEADESSDSDEVPDASLIGSTRLPDDSPIARRVRRASEGVFGPATDLAAQLAAEVAVMAAEREAGSAESEEEAPQAPEAAPASAMGALSEGDAGADDSRNFDDEGDLPPDQAVAVGLGRIVALYYRSFTSHQNR